MSTPTSNGREGLRFFGRVSASVSHEIKNVFAVINEAAGLIEDFTLMADKGMPIDPERLKKAAKSIQGQIQRGDGIIKNMNTFAHSADEDASTIDLVETLDLAVALSTRMADMKQVTLTIGESQPASTHTSHFDLMRLLYGAIMAILDTMEPGDGLTVGIQPKPAGMTFIMTAPGRILAPPTEAGFSQLAHQLGASATTNADNGSLELCLVPSV